MGFFDYTWCITTPMDQNRSYLNNLLGPKKCTKGVPGVPRVSISLYFDQICWKFEDLDYPVTGLTIVWYHSTNTWLECYIYGSAQWQHSGS